MTEFLLFGFGGDIALHDLRVTERRAKLARVTSEKQLITVFHDGSPQNKELAEPRLAQAIGNDYVNGRGYVHTMYSSLAIFYINLLVVRNLDSQLCDWTGIC